MLGFTLGWIGVPQERPVPQWVGRSANAPCKIISSPSLNRCLFRKTGNGNGELIDTVVFPNTPIYLFPHASLTLQPLPLFLS